MVVTVDYLDGKREQFYTKEFNTYRATFVIGDSAKEINKGFVKRVTIDVHETKQYEVNLARKGVFAHE